MTQNREPPAYQEYPATIMAKVQYRTMSLEQRGLLFTLKMECWINQSLPYDESSLAKILGFPKDQIRRCLPAAMYFFHEVSGCIRSQELDDYRAHLESRKIKQAEGGRKGAKITNEKMGRKSSAKSSANPSSEVRVDSRAFSTAQQIPEQPSQNQSLDMSLDAGVVSFVSAYENNELPNW